MILSLSLPRVGALMRQGTIHKLLAKPGDELRPGVPLLEVRVDLGAANAHDCPPLFFFRVIATERAFLRSWVVSQAALLEVGAPLGVASTQSGETFEGPAARTLRTTCVAVQIDPLAR
jgi:hypothetical protein